MSSIVEHEARSANLKSNLLAKKEELIAGIDRELASLRDSRDACRGDMAERTHASTSQNVNAVLLNKYWAEHRQVELALQKLESGSYGVCVACGNSISENRLMALPFAQRCKSCQEKLENSRRR